MNPSLFPGLEPISLRPFVTSVLMAAAASLCLVPAADAKPRKAKPAATAPAAPPALNPDGTLHTPTIDDAPKGDFERVAWCHGILSGDMELAEVIGPLEPVDPRIQTIGRSYLRAYEAALTLSSDGKSKNGRAIAEKARQRGYDAWAAARTAEIRKAAYAYDSWQLPGDCEHAAVRISGHPNLFAEMATDEEAVAINEALNSGGPHDYSELPKPKLTAQTVKQDSDEAISSNTIGRRVKQAQTLPTTPPVTASPPPAPEQPKDAAASPSAYAGPLGEKPGWDGAKN
jgi:hypothetical protein